MSRILLPLTIACALAAGLGTAISKPTRVQRARAIAIRHFGIPCAGEPIEITKANLGRAPDGRLWLAMALWNDNSWPFHDCHIVLSTLAEPWPTPKLCTVIAHEYLHFKIGDRHSSDWRSLMYPRYIRPWPPCL